MSSASYNKALLQSVFAETAKGNGRPVVDLLSDDVRWTIIGTTAWSRTYSGKHAVVKELLGPLSAQLGASNVITAKRFIAEDDLAVVEGEGHNHTASGKPYANSYCWVFRFREGRVIELTEYTDTALIDSTLEAPLRA
jgi:ketosteroid isomerase-like protein